MEFLPSLIWFISGAAITGLVINFVYRKVYVRVGKYNELEKEKILIEERYQILKSSSNSLDQLLKQKEIECSESHRIREKKEHENIRLQEKIQFQQRQFDQLNEQFNQKFEQIAGKILSRNADDFSKLNHERLGLILNPLKEKIEKFEKKVEESHRIQSIESNLLKKEIINLASLNQQMSEDANNLSNALKGNNKVQGNWGELVLEKVLESSGLTKGIEYFIQGKGMALKGEIGQHQKPDVVILLPDEKHIVIDAKVSLKAYVELVNAEDEENRLNFQKLHINSVRSHVKSLSEKYYSSIEKLSVPDFVLLFLPMESSFSSAFTGNNEELFQFAWDRKVVIVSPTTLLATLRTVASIWKNDKQNKNALVIADESGKLYDKFHAFIGDLEKLGRHLKQGQETYDLAVKKLSTGKGNLLDKAEKLRKMGINNKKSIENPFKN